MTKRIAVYIDTTIKFFAAKKVLNELSNREIELIIYCPVDSIDFIKAELDNGRDVRDLDEILKKNQLARKIYQLLFLVAIQKHGTFLSRLRADSASITTKLFRFFLSPVFWFYNADKLNYRFAKLFSRLVSNPFNTSTVVVVSRPHEKVSFCAKNLSVITIQESWDHPFQAPLGYCSDLVISWNRETAESWIKLQGDRNVIPGFPEKLSYATVSPYHVHPALPKRKMRRVLYPLTFCSESPHQLFNEELMLIQLIADSLSENGISLYVKPKPNADPKELDTLRATHPNIEIGHFNQKSTNTYSLSHTYNLIRLNEIDSTDLVINLGTTFGLDASARGKPVIQLRITEASIFPNLSKLAKYDHLKSVFYQNKTHLYDIQEKEDIHQLGKQVDSLAHSLGLVYSEYLRDWLLAGVSPSSWVEDCCEQIEALTSF